ncbi:SEC-C domain-containing protein [bacterium]|nr:SEC-C domain-containing protein [bacterium]
MPLLDEEAVRQVVSELAATHLETRPADPIGFLQELSKVYGTAPIALAHGRMNDLSRGSAGFQPTGQQDAGASTADATDLARQLRDLVREEPDEDESPIGLKDFRRMERYWLLTSVDKAWMAHLLNMDELREGIHLRGHAQRDPLIEYQREASELFDHLMAIIAQRTTQKAFSGTEAAEMDGFMLRGLQTQTAELPDAGPVRTVTRGEQKIPRNAPCPCGSGKKYKVCCMKD